MNPSEAVQHIGDSPLSLWFGVLAAVVGTLIFIYIFAKLMVEHLRFRREQKTTARDEHSAS